MTRPSRYPQEVRERAVRMVFEHRDEYPSQWAAIASIAEKFGMTSETLRRWVRTAEIDHGSRPGLSTDERERLKGLTSSVAQVLDPKRLSVSNAPLAR
jgi:transposase